VRTSERRGYSIVELLVVVAVIGLVLLVTVPALFQLMPQYRIRSAASEAASAMRMMRQRAVTTRTPHRVSFDFARNRYSYSMLNGPFADMAVETNWTKLRVDGRNLAPGNNFDWVRISAVQLVAGSNTFKDVPCPKDGYLDLIFTRDGSVSDKATCGDPASDTLEFTPTIPTVIFWVDSSFVRYNRYYVEVNRNGRIGITPKKE
jgi:prepilin-type N-terminal cleavage/methylation domain-containing protein